MKLAFSLLTHLVVLAPSQVSPDSILSHLLVGKQPKKQPSSRQQPKCTLKNQHSGLVGPLLKTLSWASQSLRKTAVPTMAYKPSTILPLFLSDVTFHHPPSASCTAAPVASPQSLPRTRHTSAPQRHTCYSLCTIVLPQVLLPHLLQAFSHMSLSQSKFSRYPILNVQWQRNE